MTLVFFVIASYSVSVYSLVDFAFIDLFCLQPSEAAVDSSNTHKHQWTNELVYSCTGATVHGHLERLMQGQKNNYIPTGRQAGRQMGVSLQMCIPAARGVMEPLNEAQQECKQNRVKDGAWGRLRVGPEEEEEESRSQTLCIVLSFVQ